MSKKTTHKMSLQKSTNAIWKQLAIIVALPRFVFVGTAILQAVTAPTSLFVYMIGGGKGQAKCNYYQEGTN